jgi:hypothetical protein
VGTEGGIKAVKECGILQRRAENITQISYSGDYAATWNHVAGEKIYLYFHDLSFNILIILIQRFALMHLMSYFNHCEKKQNYI